MPIVPGDAKDQEANDLTDSATQGEREDAHHKIPQRQKKPALART
jgi:hypothetical protein